MMIRTGVKIEGRVEMECPKCKVGQLDTDRAYTKTQIRSDDERAGLLWTGVRCRYCGTSYSVEGYVDAE